MHRADVQTVKLGTTIGNIGLEGVTFDPKTGHYIFVKEKEPRSIFETGIDFAAGTATNGSPTTDESINLFDPSLVSTLDFSDVYALSNLPSLAGDPTFDQLLIISQESGQIVQVDRSGSVKHTLTIVADPGDTISVPDMTMEGITMDRDGILYVANEDGGGDANHPQLWVYAPSTAANLAPTAVSLTGAVTSLPENTSTTDPVKLADILVADDGLGDNNLSLSGPDAGSFQIIGTALFLKAGTALNAATQSSYHVTVNVDDTTVGATPDASTSYTLTITPAASGAINLAITEAAPWSSGNSPARGRLVRGDELRHLGGQPGRLDDGRQLELVRRLRALERRHEHQPRRIGDLHRDGQLLGARSQGAGVHQPLVRRNGARGPPDRQLLRVRRRPLHRR